jgi:hypothetical protein
MNSIVHTFSISISALVLFAGCAAETVEPKTAPRAATATESLSFASGWSPDCAGALGDDIAAFGDSPARERLVLLQNMNVRLTPPDLWGLGNRIGTLPSGTVVDVYEKSDYFTIEGWQIWVFVSPVTGGDTGWIFAGWYGYPSCSLDVASAAPAGPPPVDPDPAPPSDDGETASDWTCTTSWYGTSDGCDCNCGSRDPDCDDPSQRLFRCAAGEYCDASGSCRGM